MIQYDKFGRPVKFYCDSCGWPFDCYEQWLEHVKHCKYTRNWC